jgi:hypothetical protein
MLGARRHGGQRGRARGGHVSPPKLAGVHGMKWEHMNDMNDMNRGHESKGQNQDLNQKITKAKNDK